MNLTQNNRKSPVSLIPYLTSGRNGLMITLAVDPKKDLKQQQVRDVADPVRYPFFHVVSDSNPFSKIIRAEIHTGAEMAAEPSLLLVQKDRYGPTEAINPPNNHSLNQNWQDTFLYYSRNRLINPPVVINDQISSNGELLPFQPLWYCGYKQAFFRPLCPNCGEPLEQCEDDDLLVKGGLQPFAASLDRYLYCPACMGSGDASACFYTPVLPLDAPENLKCRDDLIVAMENLKEKAPPGDRLPCVGCDQHPVCFNSGKKALERIAVFSFFPFYMIVFKAVGAHSPDLIPATSAWQTARPASPDAEKTNSPLSLHADGIPSESSLDVDAAKMDIRRILNHILEKWQKKGEHEPAFPETDHLIVPADGAGRAVSAAIQHSATDDLERTVIIASRKDITEKIQTMAENQDPDKTLLVAKNRSTSYGKTPEEMSAPLLEKTVIITADSVETSVAAPETSQGRASGREGEATVIIGSKSRNMAADANRSPIQKDHGEDLAKTVLIDRQAKDAGSELKQNGRTIIFGDDLPDNRPLPKAAEPDEPLEKTVILQKPRGNYFNGRDDG